MAELSIHAEAAHDHEALRSDNLKTAMWLYLASEVVLFSMLIAFFLILRIRTPEIIEEGREALNVLFVSVNTFVLLASSWAMVMGLLNMQRGKRDDMIRWIGLTALLGTLFVGLQLAEYTELAHEGIGVYNSEFGMRFYALTAFHGAHVIVGVIWAFVIMVKGMKGDYSADNTIGIEIFGLYWHFVDVVWIILFTMIYLI